MNIAVSSDELEVLEQQLEQALQAQLAQNTPLQVRCGLKQDTLLVVVQHLPDDELDSHQAFSTLEQVLRTLESQVGYIQRQLFMTQSLAVRLYLRSLGQRQPYATHLVVLGKPEFSDESAIGTEFRFSDVTVDDDDIAAIATPAANRVDPSDWADRADPADQTDQADISDRNPQSSYSTAPAAASGAIVLRDKAIASPEAEMEDTAVSSASAEGLSGFSRSLGAAIASLQKSLPLSPVILVSGLAVGLISFSSVLYMLTRPCVVGTCEPLQTAEQLSQTALQTVQTTTSAQDVVDAYEQLAESNYLLGTIPSWSSYHTAAQTLLSSYAVEFKDLGLVVEALKQATLAAEKSQNPPHPLSEWQAIQKDWRRTIALLGQVSPNSSVAVLAQRKLEDYQANLEAINRRIKVEQDAQDKIALARSTAQIAATRAGIANSVESWQLTHATWQTAVKQLYQIPQGTMAYAEAQQLLAIYQPKLATARDRRTQEEISANAYNQALSLADRARSLESQNQWSQAVDEWRSALTNAQQVPNGTSYHNQAQPLVNSYATALSRAQESLRLAVGLQAAEGNLERTCAGVPRICTYTLGNEVIRVQITSAYDQAVEQALAATEMSGDFRTRAEVAAHVNTFLRAIAAISDNAQVPIELHNSDGSLFGTYVPNLSGFVPRQADQQANQ